MYAIFERQGKQHKVSEGDVIDVDLLGDVQSETVEFDQVLLSSKEGDVKVGTPYVSNAKVVAEILGDVKDRKVVAFTYRRRKSSSRKVGHRQGYTRLRIKEIVA